MQRIVYEKVLVEGFTPHHVESMATTGTNVLYAGCNDGSLLRYNFLLTPSSQKCTFIDNLRKQYKDDKFVQSLQVVESWHVLICIIDHIVTIYDLQTHAMIASITDSKGCSMFTVQESTSTIAIVHKSKLILYKRNIISSLSAPKHNSSIAPINHSNSYQYQFHKECSLPDTPRLAQFIANHVMIVGFKRHYEILNVDTLISYHILEIEKEHKMICTQVSRSH